MFSNLEIFIVSLMGLHKHYQYICWQMYQWISLQSVLCTTKLKPLEYLYNIIIYRPASQLRKARGWFTKFCIRLILFNPIVLDLNDLHRKTNSSCPLDQSHQDYLCEKSIHKPRVIQTLKCSTSQVKPLNLWPFKCFQLCYK